MVEHRWPINTFLCMSVCLCVWRK